MAPFVVLRAVILLAIIPTPVLIGWYNGLDLWSDFRNRETAYVPAQGVRVTEFKCPGPTCIIKLDGGLSATGRSTLYYGFFNNFSGRNVDLVRSTVDGSIAAQFARERLGERTLLLFVLEVLIIGAIIFLARYTWRSVRYVVTGA